MFQYSEKIILNTNGIHLYEITDTVAAWIRKNEVSNGLLNISIQHTSASLLIQENADPKVLDDLINYFLNLVPFNNEYKHSSEGKDDMPAHIKASLTNSNLTLSILDNKLCLGIWQGIFLFEHRTSKKNRELVFHFIGK